MILNDIELKNINGGVLSATFIGYLVRGINGLLDIGRSLGSALRRVQENRICPL